MQCRLPGASASLVVSSDGPGVHVRRTGRGHNMEQGILTACECTVLPTPCARLVRHLRAAAQIVCLEGRQQRTCSNEIPVEETGWAVFEPGAEMYLVPLSLS